MVKYCSEDIVVFVLCGDGVMSEGDFYEVMNFVVVFYVFVVFFV